MFFGHSPALWAAFPQLVPGVLVATGIDPDAEPCLEPWYGRARERLSRGPESELAEVSAWRRAFAQMGFPSTAAVRIRAAGPLTARAARCP